MQFETPGPVEAELADAIAPIEEIIEEARQGRMFVLVDHEDRENEGDLVIPAQFADADAINFMATHGRGLICLPMTEERVNTLGLPMMAVNNSARHETAFTVSIEAREGVTTGISAADRALTVKVAIDEDKVRLFANFDCAVFRESADKFCSGVSSSVSKRRSGWSMRRGASLPDLRPLAASPDRCSIGQHHWCRHSPLTDCRSTGAAARSNYAGWCYSYEDQSTHRRPSLSTRTLHRARGTPVSRRHY
mgnify:CR=1 FL=1